MRGARAMMTIDGFSGPLIDVKLRDGGVRPHFAHIRHEIAQSERRMDIAGIQGREQDLRHRSDCGAILRGRKAALFERGEGSRRRLETKIILARSFFQEIMKARYGCCRIPPPLLLKVRD